VSALLRLVRRAWAWVTRLTRRVTRVGVQTARSAGTRTISFVRNAVQRLAVRWHSDSAYRRTLLAALTAVTATLLPHPVAAAAVGALVAERPGRPAYRRDPFLDEDDEDEDYAPRRATRSADPWAPAPRRLWDDLQ